MKRVLVCGGRHYNNIPYLCGFLDCYHSQFIIDLIIEGGATGADNLARRWALMNRVPFETVAADWRRHGNTAGLIRNREMYDKWKPDVIIAFPGGPGTADMVTYARSRHATIIRAGGGLDG